MTQLDEALLYVLRNYRDARAADFAHHPVANFIRGELATVIEKIVDDQDRYLVEGSPGQGNWAYVPWVAIFDRLITETAQEGYYIVYLFAEDSASVYLSLNQGVTTVRREYGAGAKHALRVRAADFLARLGKVQSPFTSGPIYLGVSDSNGLGAFYEAGSICAKRYQVGEMDSNQELANDLRYLINQYDLLTRVLNARNVGTEVEDDEFDKREEDLTKMRSHKRIERNRTLAKKVKKVHGYTCQACGFQFERTYGSIGKEFIEAHHLTPISRLVGQRVSLDPKKDFAVLCANCHRMIHKAEADLTIEDFRLKHLLPK